MDTGTFKILIFGGTTEGRKLAEYCAENNISADVSVATEYGASLLPEKINKLVGKLDVFQMTELLIINKYSLVIDATHPYAVEATKNIISACEKANIPYYRLLRDIGETCNDSLTMEQLIEKLNESEKTVLSTLGSKSLSELTKINNYKNRVWLRLLPADEIINKCSEMGYDPQKIILKKGPFTIEENTEHIKLSGAEILITKDSGKTGGYDEKLSAAKACGIEIITLARPSENGFDYDSIIDIIKAFKEEKI